MIINTVMLMQDIIERKLTSAEYKERESLKKKYDKTDMKQNFKKQYGACLLYTSPSPRDATLSRMPSSA